MLDLILQFFATSRFSWGRLEQICSSSMAVVTLWPHGFVIFIFLVCLDNSGHRKIILMVNENNEFCVKDCKLVLLPVV